jgi:hypothetical protein
MHQPDTYKTTELEVASFLRARGHRLMGASPSGRLVEFAFDNGAAPDVDAYIDGAPISALDLFEARRSLGVIIQHVQQHNQNGAEHEPGEATSASGGAEPGGTYANGERVAVELVTTDITPHRTHTELHIRFNQRNPEHVQRAKELTANMFYTLRQLSATAAIDSGNFIDRYTEYADVTETPRLMHTVVAVQLVATLLNRNKVVFKNGPDTIPLDLWVLLLSQSGGGRNVTVNRARKLLKQAHVSNLTGSNWGSIQGCYQDLAERPYGLWVWPEMSVKLAQFNRKEFAGLQEWLTDRYDEFNLPEDVAYRKTGKQDTPPIVFLEPPRLNLLATSSEAWFFPHLKTADTTGGFIPRWIIMRAGESGRVIATPDELDEKLGAQLVKDLQAIAELRGEADMSAVIDTGLYKEWYDAARERFYGHSDHTARVFFHRHRQHVLKLAVVYEAASSYTLQVTPASWHRAVATASELEAVIMDLLKTGMNKLGYERSKAEQFFYETGAKGASKAEYTRKFQATETKFREDQLQTLLDAEKIRVLPVSPGGIGRKPEIYAHRDFWKEAGLV